MAEESFDRDIKYPRIRFRTRSRINRDLDNCLNELRARQQPALHLGAGETKFEHMINCDYFDSRSDRKVSALDLREFADNSVGMIESHHMIEHLSFAEADLALEEWARALRPGGFLVLSCPDITLVCWRWLIYSILEPLWPKTEKQEYVLKMMMGSQEREGMFHKSAYDARRMRRVLAGHGFTVDFTYCPYPPRRTPSLLVIARKDRP